MSAKSHGVRVVVAGIIVNLALGVLYTWSIVTQALTTEQAKAAPVLLSENAFGWVATDALAPYALALLAFAFTMVGAGRLQDKFGPRMVITAGGVFVGAGMALASTTNFAADASHWQLVVGFGLLVGGGIGLAYASATPAAVKWFDASKRGLISGLVVGGFGLASVYTAPLTKWLISEYGLKGMFTTLAVAFLAVIITAAQFIRNPREDELPAPAVAAATAGSSAPAVTRDIPPSGMLRTPQFYLLWAMYAFVAFAGLMIVGLIAKVAPEQLGDPEFGAKWGYTLIVSLAIGNGLGRPLVGIISDKLGRVPTMMGAFVLQAIMVGALLPLANTLPMLLLVAAAIGSLYGANLTLFPATTYDFFGTKNGGVNYGLVFTAWGVGGAIGSYFSGWVKATYGSFTPAYYVAAGLCVLAAVLALAVRPPKVAPQE